MRPYHMAYFIKPVLDVTCWLYNITSDKKSLEFKKSWILIE